MKSFLEKFSKWALRPILFLSSIYCAWYALWSYASLGPQDSIVGGPAVVAVASILLIKAALSPAPPWKNEPLKAFCRLVVLAIVVLAWWIGSVLGAGYLLKSIFGQDPKLGPLFPFLSIVLIFTLQYYIYVGLRKLWHSVTNEPKHIDRAS